MKHTSASPKGGPPVISLRHNPLIWREARRNLRPQHLVGWGMTTGGVMLLVMLLLAVHLSTENAARRNDPDANLPRYFAYFCFGVQTLLAMFIALWTSLDAVVIERRQDSYVFLETLPLTPAEKVVGLAIGRNLPCLLLMACYGVVGVVAGLAGGVEMGRMLWLEAILLTGWAATVMIGLTLSIHSGRSSLGVILLILYLLLSLGITGPAIDGEGFDAWPMLTLAPFASMARSVAPLEDLSHGRDGMIGFVLVDVPWQLCPISVYLLLAGAFFHSAARGLSRPSNPLARRSSALIVAPLLHIWLLGFLADTFDSGFDAYDWASAGMLYMSAFVSLTFIWVLAHSPDRQAVMEWTERAGRWHRWFSECLTEKGAAAVWPGIALMLIAVAAALATPHIYPLAVYPEVTAGLPEVTTAILLAAGIILPYFIAYGCLYAVGRLLSEKSGPVLGFLLFLAPILLPLLFAAASGRDGILSITPIGGLGYVCDYVDSFNGDDTRIDTQTRYVVSLVAGLALMALSVVFLAASYQRLYLHSPAGKSEQDQRGPVAA
ncbi:MAG: hypothetical protein GVY16_02315 [Planctomycetes bacterium]|nr:hypothetical protein [Planctomycetota bacterium]